jgi:hypothetical protein
MKLKTQNMLNLRLALLALDGLTRAVEVNGKTELVKKPFKLSGTVRKKIARNLRVLQPLYDDYDHARVALIRELADGGESVPEEKMPQFNVQHEAMLAEIEDITLTPLSDDDLNLEQNEIPHLAVAIMLEHLEARADA